MSSELVTLTALAEYLGVSRPTAYKIVRSVGFPQPVPIDGGKPRWSIEAVRRYQSEQSQPVTE